VLQIRDILVRIRVRGSVPLTNGSRSESCYFVSDLQDAKKILFAFLSFFPYSFLKVHLHHFPKIKSHKKSQNSRNQGIFCLMTDGSGSVPLTNGSGSWKPQNIRIRIRNTGYNFLSFKQEGKKLYSLVPRI
jgi:hypothetical protein